MRKALTIFAVAAACSLGPRSALADGGIPLGGAGGATAACKKGESCPPRVAPVGGALSAVWASGPNDVFAVGYPSTILHYDGTTWRPMAFPTHASLDSVWGVSATDVWAVGTDPELLAVVLHYDGRAWKRVVMRKADRFQTVWARSADDVWVGGGESLRHWDGRKWRELSRPSVEWTKDIWSIRGRGADAFVGDDNSLWPLADAHAATDRREAHAVSTGESIGSLSIAAGQEGWALGGKGRLWHRHKGNWNLFPEGPFRMISVWTGNPDDAWLVGWSARVLHWNGSLWSPVPNPFSAAGESAPDLFDVFGTSVNDVWAVGSLGAILHWDGRAWTISRAPLSPAR